ncbi:GIY-YIG nuclease family protein [Candidatus Kaiserbacteria bacterium]|nr:GIY-YIG nuclease family protein [Candidatus Kaiserbacteria bacterium]
MQKTDLKRDQLPDSPGVYFFLGPRKQILYIGKATSLKNRILSYFVSDLISKRSPLIEKMVREAKTIDYTVTDSVLEALILETNLIRSHKPIYNTRSKDDKSYNHLIITKEEYPRVLVVREKDITEKFSVEEIMYDFGPFSNGKLFKDALKIIRKLFKFYDSDKPITSAKSKLAKGIIDFNRQICLYPDDQDKKSYQRTIRHIQLFFEGKKNKIITELTKEMNKLAKEYRFEEADLVKKRIFALQHIQDVALIKDDLRIYRDNKTMRIESYDIAHLGGQNMVGVMVVMEGGELMKSEYRKFKINSVDKSNDTKALCEVLERRLLHKEWPRPQIIVVDGSTAQKNIAEKILKKFEISIPVVAVVKDHRHKPVKLLASQTIKDQHKNNILLANAESHRFAINYHRQKQNKTFLG